MFVNSLKAILIYFLNLIKRSLCCFRRRRKSSSDVVPLTDIGIVPSNNQYTSQKGEELQNWSTWEDANDALRQPQTIQEHIEHYRNTATRTQQELDEIQPNFFQDMEPRIKKTPKMFLKPKESTPVTSRLAFSPDTTLSNDAAELRSWEETENRDGEWAHSDEWNTEEILRQKRREEKKKKILEREQKRFIS